MIIKNETINGRRVKVILDQYMVEDEELDEDYNLLTETEIPHYKHGCRLNAIYMALEDFVKAVRDDHPSFKLAVKQKRYKRY